MLCVPAVSAEVEHDAVRVLPLPASATAEHPAIEDAPSVKLTVPPGLKPVTDAVKVTLAPTAEGSSELDSELDEAALFTTWVSVELVEALLDALPPYAALMPWLPAVRADVAQVAVRVLPEPVSAAAEQPEMDVDPSLKFTVPVGEVPLTVAVKVTLLPTVEGVSDVAMLVVLPEALTACDRAALFAPVLEASPP
jgi:hypothetical protein